MDVKSPRNKNVKISKVYLLDTNICIYAIKSRPRRVIEKITSHLPEQIVTSSVVVSELMFGIQKSVQIEKNHNALLQFLSPMTVLSYGYEQAEAYGIVRAELEKKGSSIGPYDLMIAAHALSLEATLVTNNAKEFRRVRGLEVENWAR